MAIPIAKSLGLKISTSGSGSNNDRVLKLGTDEFFDYRKIILKFYKILITY